MSQFASSYGIGESQLFNWLKREDPPLPKHWGRLSEFFGVSVQYLVSGMPAAEPPKVCEVSDALLPDRVEESPAEYQTATARQIREEITRFVELTLAAAGEDVGKLGYLREMLRIHFAPPPHWRQRELTPEDHLRALHSVMEEERTRHTDQSSSPAKHSETGS